MSASDSRQGFSEEWDTYTALNDGRELLAGDWSTDGPADERFRILCRKALKLTFQQVIPLPTQAEYSSPQRMGLGSVRKLKGLRSIGKNQG